MHIIGHCDDDPKLSKGGSLTARQRAFSSRLMILQFAAHFASIPCVSPDQPFESWSLLAKLATNFDPWHCCQLEPKAFNLKKHNVICGMREQTCFQHALISDRGHCQGN